MPVFGRGRGRHAAAEEVREKLGRFAGRPRFNDEFEEAFEFFFGESVEHLQETLEEDDFERFMEWFVYDYRLANGHRLIEIFDLEHGSDLSRPARRILKGWEQSNLTLLELHDRIDDTCIFVDVLTGQRYEVAADSVHPGMLRWSLVISRPLHVGATWELSSAQTVLPAVAKEPLLALLRGEYRRQRHVQGDLPVVRFLREQGFLFNDLLVEVDVDSSISFLEGNEAHRIVHCRALYSMLDSAKVVERLLAYADIEEVRPGRMIWYESSARNDGSDPTSRVLAEIQVSGNRLQMHCWSRQRLQSAKQLIADRLRGLVAHLIDAFEELSARGSGNGTGLCTLNETELAAVASSKVAIPADQSEGHGSEQQAAHGPGRSSQGEDPASGKSPGGVKCLDLETGAWAKAAYEDYIDSWINQPLKALDGKTPRFLRGKTLGRMRLTELLKKLEHQQQVRIAQGRGLATADALRHRLGLDADAKEHHLIARLDEGPTVWNSDAERQVLEIVQDVFRQRGYSEAHVDAVSWMWWEYCYRAYPQVRKPEAWAAALHYAMGLVESWEITQDHAAELYDTSVGSVSANARKIMDLLDLEPYDDRFCVDLPVNALLEHLEGPMYGEEDAKDDPISFSLALAAQVRRSVHEFFAGNDALRQRAAEFFFSHVGSSPQDALWRESFLDWLHFDWHVPVMGGRTLVQAALEEGKLNGEIRELLEDWSDVHPSFYVVEGVVERGSHDRFETPRITLRELVSGVISVVDALWIDRPIGSKDIVLARLVSIAGFTISLGPVILLPAASRTLLQRIVEEDRALVNRWNDDYIEWDTYRARYAERLYAVAFRLATEGQGRPSGPQGPMGPMGPTGPAR